MRAYRMHRPGDARLESVPKPVAGPGEVLVAPLVCGVCGTDTHLFFNGVNWAGDVITMGHEAVGIVIELGEDTDGAARPYPSVQVGDLVTVDPLLPCGRCRQCLRRRPNICLKRSHLGLWRDGVYAELVAVPARRVLRLPSATDHALAVMVEPLACAVEAIDAAAVGQDDDVAVLGAGAFGALITAVACERGARSVTVIDPLAARHDVVQQFGAATTARDSASFQDDFSVVIEAAGADAAVNESVRIAAHGGRIVLGGLCNSPRVAVATNDIVLKGLQMIGTVSHAWRLPDAFALLESGAIDPSPLIGRTYAFDQVDGALRASHAGTEGKPLVRL